MTPQQLRNSILQMAIEGKLTEQRAEDGNASDLLKEIKAEKAKLIAEKKIKKEKPLPEISEDEIPFEIPDNWVWTRLGDIARFQGGYAYKSGEYVATSNNQVIRLGNVKNDKLLLDVNPVFITNDYADNTQQYCIKVDDILFTMTGTRRKRDYFYTKLITNDDIYSLNLFLNQRVGCIRSYEICDKKWLNLVLKSLFVLNQIFESETGTANQGNIGSEATMKLLIPLPPLAEQKRIVARLEEILPQVDEYEKAYNELQELNKKFPDNLKNSLLQMAIEGKLVEQRAEDGNARDLLKEIQAEKAKLIAEKKIKKEKPLPEISEDEIPFEIPDNWVWCRLDDIVSKEIRRGKSPKYDEAGSAFAFAQKCNSKYDGIRLDLARKISDESLKRYGDDELLQDKDIIINSTGNGTLGRIGMYKEIYNTNNDKYFADSHVTVVRIQKNILSEYIHIALLSYHKYLTSLGEGSTNQTELKPLIIKSLLIPIPPLAEQKRIVAKLEQILPLCDELSKEYK